MAPSPPITSNPTRAGIKVHSAASNIGAAKVSEFSIEIRVPNDPTYRARY
jgi:hypothetical protein